MSDEEERIPSLKERIASLERQCKRQSSPDVSKASPGRKLDDLSATTCTTSSTSFGRNLGKGGDKVGSRKEESPKNPKKENLLGTCVSFTERDDCSEATSCSPQNGSQADEEDCDATDDVEDCSEDALMAAIAAATAKKGEETSYAAFFASAEAEAVAAAEQMGEESALEQEESREKGDVDDLFQRIEEQLSSPLLNGNSRGANTSKGSSVQEVLQDLERVFFFTDVIDRNPPPPSTFGTTGALMSPSAMMDPWWEAKMREVSNTIYQSGVDIYNGIERTSNEVQRVVLFTDVPEGPAPPSTDTQADVAVCDVEPSSEAILDLAACTSDSTKTGIPMTTFSEEDHGEEEAQEELEVAPEMSKTTDGFNHELGRLFKGLEQKLLFTDLPDGAVPVTASGDRSPTASMSLTPTASAQSASVNSELAVCRDETALLSQVLEESSDVKKQFLSRLEQAREQEASSEKVAEVEKSENPTVETTLAVGSILDQLSEDSTSVFTAPEMSDISSHRGASNDRMAPVEAMPDLVSDIKAAAFSTSHAKDVPSRQSSGVSDSPILSDRAGKELEREAPPMDGDLTEYDGASVIRADSSAENTEKSVRLLVEVKVNKSRSDSIESGSWVQAARSDTFTSCNEREAGGEREEDEAKEVQINHEKPGRSWTSQDDQNLAQIMQTMVSDDNNSQDVAKAMSAILTTVGVEGQGSLLEENSKAGSEVLSWVDCSSSHAETYATADDSVSRQTERHQPTQTFLTSCDIPSDKAAPQDAAKSSIECPNMTRANDPQEKTESVPPPEATVIPTTDTFDALLAEMKDLETAINFDLQRAHVVLRKTMQESDGLY